MQIKKYISTHFILLNYKIKKPSIEHLIGNNLSILIILNLSYLRIFTR